VGLPLDPCGRGADTVEGDGHGESSVVGVREKTTETSLVIEQRTARSHLYLLDLADHQNVIPNLLGAVRQAYQVSRGPVQQRNAGGPQM